MVIGRVRMTPREEIYNDRDIVQGNKSKITFPPLLLSPSTLQPALLPNTQATYTSTHEHGKPGHERQ